MFANDQGRALVLDIGQPRLSNHFPQTISLRQMFLVVPWLSTEPSQRKLGSLHVALCDAAATDFAPHYSPTDTADTLTEVRIKSTKNAWTANVCLLPATVSFAGLYYPSLGLWAVCCCFGRARSSKESDHIGFVADHSPQSDWLCHGCSLLMVPMLSLVLLAAFGGAVLHLASVLQRVSCWQRILPS